MRASVASTTSRAVTSPARMRRACSAAPARASVVASMWPGRYRGDHGERLRTAAKGPMLWVGMTSSARRLLALAALAGLGGAVTAQAVAATGGARAHATTAAANKRTKAKAKAKTKARAVKLSGGVAWVPASVLAPSRAPLTGTTGGNNSGASGGPASGSGPTGGSTPPTTTTPTTPDPPPQQQALGATVDERTGYTMLLSRTTLTAGSVVVQLINKGEDPHNLRIVRTSPSGGAPADLPEAAPQQQSSKTLTLSSGSYGSETGRTESGGGQSLYESRPSFQSGINQSGSNRLNPDVAFDR